MWSGPLGPQTGTDSCALSVSLGLGVPVPQRAVSCGRWVPDPPQPPQPPPYARRKRRLSALDYGSSKQVSRNCRASATAYRTRRSMSTRRSFCNSVPSASQSARLQPMPPVLRGQFHDCSRPPPTPPHCPPPRPPVRSTRRATLSLFAPIPPEPPLQARLHWGIQLMTSHPFGKTPLFFWGSKAKEQNGLSASRLPVIPPMPRGVF